MKVTTRMIKEWCNLYTQQNISIPQLAKRYNVSETTVRAYLHLNGIKTPRPHHHYIDTNRLYYDKYMIGVYDLEDNLCWNFNNAREMAETLNHPLNSIQCRLIRNNVYKKFRHQGKWYRVCLIEVEEDASIL